MQKEKGVFYGEWQAFMHWPRHYMSGILTIRRRHDKVVIYGRPVHLLYSGRRII